MSMTFMLSATKAMEFPLETSFSCAAAPKSNHKSQNLGDYDTIFFLPIESPSGLLIYVLKDAF